MNLFAILNDEDEFSIKVQQEINDIEGHSEHQTFTAEHISDNKMCYANNIIIKVTEDSAWNKTTLSIIKVQRKNQNNNNQTVPKLIE